MVLTNAEVDHAAGLLALRERQPFAIWGTRATLDTVVEAVTAEAGDAVATAIVQQGADQLASAAVSEIDLCSGIGLPKRFQMK